MLSAMMRKGMLLLTAVCALSLSSCRCVFHSHCMEKIAFTFGSEHKGVDMYAPANMTVFRDDSSYYYFAPLKSYDSSCPLFSTSNSTREFPYASDIKDLGKKLFVRVTPKTYGKAEVTIWTSKKEFSYAISPSENGQTIDVTLIGDKYKRTLRNLKPTSLSSAAEVERVFKNYRVPSHASIPKEEEDNLPGIVNLVAMPVVVGGMVTAAALDVTYFLTMNITNGIGVFLFRSWGGADKEEKPKPLPGIDYAEIISL